MRRPWLVAIACVLGCSRPAPVEAPSGPVPVSDAIVAANRGKLPEEVTPLAYALSLEIVPEREVFRGAVRIELELSAPVDALHLHARALSFRRVVLTLPGQRPFALVPQPLGDSGLMALALPEPLGPTRATLELDYEGRFDPHLRGLYRVQSADAAYAFTQFEAIDARQAFPCFDEPRFKTPFDITLRVPGAATAISNTRVVSERPLEGGLREVVFARTEKLPTYLVAFAVGPLAVVHGGMLPSAPERQAPVPLRGVAPKGRGGELGFALTEAPQLLASLENYLGSGYPYDKLDLIAVPDFAAGAMENAGAITFRDTLLLVGERAPEWQRRASLSVTAHELAHQWFGNLVTMPWWDDLWLNEAFATWLAARVMREVHPELGHEAMRVLSVNGAMHTDSKASARKIRQPIESDHDIQNAFDGITYTKGGAVIDMFERYVGEDAFRAGLRLYLGRHRFGTATTKDLLAALEEAAQKPVAEAFSTFLDQPGVPLVTASLECAPGKRPRLALEQARYVPLGSSLSPDARWQVPVCVRHAVVPNDLTAKPSVSPAVLPESAEQCVLLDGERASVPLASEGCPTWVVPNAHARGYYRWSLRDAELAGLLEAGYDALDLAERLSLLANADAAARAGEMSFERLLEVALRVGRERERDAVSLALGVLEGVREALLTPAELPAHRRLVAELVGERATELGLFPLAPGESLETQRLRAVLVSALALEARDPVTRSALEPLGRALLGLEPDERARSLPPELVEVALTVAVQDGGAATLEHAVEALGRTTDGLERGRLLGAIAHNLDPRLTPRVLALALDARLRENERAQPIFGQMSENETRDVAWGWVREQFDTLAARFGKSRAAGLVGVSGRFCSDERAREARAFFEPRVDAIAGGPRTLALALESVSACSAYARALRPSARRHFASLGRAGPRGAEHAR